ncbi:hypothetical protein QZH41_012147 [Actinostola sp. cb2023]|nr:hypothetical protein QZH41_012147 [Actinostola sp. cb2023]
MIGKGQYGSVYKGLWKGLQVAVKQIPKGYGEPDLSEVNICRRLRHPSILMLFGCLITDTDINIVTNYIKGMNLSYAVGLATSKKTPGTPIDEKYNGFVIYHVAQGMAYLHERGVIHQDLKPANIIIEEGSYKPVICDFGISKLKDLVITTNIGGSNAGTLAYQHIDQIHGERPTTAVDVYSFAVIIGEVYARVPAWRGKNYKEVRVAIEHGCYPTFPNIPQASQKIIDDCFQPAKQRPAFTELLPELELQSQLAVW